MSGPGRFILIGHPVGHSLSPAIHTAAYAELGLTGLRYDAVDCPDAASVKEQLAAIRRGEIEGANVTVPWKLLALELADELDPSARSTGAANVLRPVGPAGARRLVAHNTDVPALASELSAGNAPVRSAAIIGNGGAALAAVAACRAMGAAEITVVARRFRGARGPAWEREPELSALGARAVAWPDEAGESSEWRAAVLRANVIVQSTSDGMSGATDGRSVAGVVPWAEVRRDAFAYDLVYNPAVTPFVASARSHGLRAESGLGMLVGQAALAIELWLGKRPDSVALRHAAEQALARKSGR